MSRARRRAALRRGHAAEWLAAGFLMLKGYRLLERRVGGKGGEIDLVMRRGGLVVFVEVKARTEMEAALSAVTAEKARLVGKTARAWLSRNGWAAGLSFRGDVVAVAGWRRPLHVEGAFELAV